MEKVTKHIRSIVNAMVICYSNGNHIHITTCKACDFHDGKTYSKRAIKCTYPVRIKL